MHTGGANSGRDRLAKALSEAMDAAYVAAGLSDPRDVTPWDAWDRDDRDPAHAAALREVYRRAASALAAAVLPPDHVAVSLQDLDYAVEWGELALQDLPRDEEPGHHEAFVRLRDLLRGAKR